MDFKQDITTVLGIKCTVPRFIVRSSRSDISPLLVIQNPHQISLIFSCESVEVPYVRYGPALGTCQG